MNKIKRNFYFFLRVVLDFLLLFLCVIFPIGQIAKFTPFIGVNIYLHDLVIFLVFFLWLIVKILYKEKFYFPSLIKSVLGFIFVAFFSWFLSIYKLKSTDLFISLLYLLRFILYTSLFLIVKDRGYFLKFFSFNYNFLIICGFISVLFGFGQYFFLPDMRGMYFLGWDPHYYRLVGSFLDASHTGLIFVFTLIILFYRLQYFKNKKSIRFYLLFFLFLTTYFALLLTYSRSSYLAYLTALFFISHFRKTYKILFFGSFLFFFSLFFLPRPHGESVRLERESTILSRLKNYKQTLKIFWANPLFGVGFNNLRFYKREFNFLSLEDWQTSHSGAGADSSFLFILATTGIVGLVCYLNFIVYLFKKYKKNLVILSSLGSWLIHSFFNNSLFYSWHMLWIWLLLAFKEYKKP